MKTLKTDSVGVLSEKNSASKYWGVSVARTGQGYTVRFKDTVSKENINFKPKSLLSEYVASVIASKFYQDRNLYSVSTEIVVDTQEGEYLVNCCSNTIEQIVKPTVEDFNKAWDEASGDRLLPKKFNQPNPMIRKLKELKAERNAEGVMILTNVEPVETGVKPGEVTCISAVTGAGRSTLNEVKPAVDVATELRKIRRKTRQIAKRIDRLAKSLKEAV